MAWNTDLLEYRPCIIHPCLRGRELGDGGKKSEGEALKRMIDETFTASKKRERNTLSRDVGRGGRIRAGELRH